jgi:hypothetical protein
MLSRHVLADPKHITALKPNAAKSKQNDPDSEERSRPPPL